MDSESGGNITLSSHAYKLLHEDILNAVLAPNQKLVPRELCQKYSIGPTPIREALNRLASEGMVLQSERRSFKVAGFDIVELDEILRTKKWLNEIGLRESMIHGGDEWEERILIALHRLSRTQRYMDDGMQGIKQSPVWDARHLEFHESLISACRSKWVMGFCRTLFFASARYRVLSQLTLEASKRQEEHRSIAEAAVQRDADTAVRLLNEHFTKTADLVRTKL